MTKWLKRLVSAIAAFGFAFPAIAENANQCAYASMTTVRFSKVETNFREKFCDKPTSKSCDARYKNISDLVARLSKDSRINNIATGAYILATVSLETGSQSFSPATTEAIGAAQKKRSYYPNFIGRGWVQLTHEDKYRLAGRKLNIDLVNHPELALKTDNSYEILVRAMTEGWLETYRSSAKGAGGGTPILLADFINHQKVDYGSARAIINANCMAAKPCDDIRYNEKGFIPDPAKLDNGEHGARNARIFEQLLCRAREQ